MRKRQILTSLPLMAGMATGWAWAQCDPAAGNPPTNPSRVEAPKAYVIGPQDVIYVGVFRVQLSGFTAWNASLSGTYTVPSDGKIILPLVGPIEAAGQTTQKLEARIREALSAYINNPPDVFVYIRHVGARPTPSPAK
jgi:protein involved in polysaccharide export with SLBB domain